MKIRPFERADAAAVRALHVGVFPTPAEADLVDALHAGGHAPISLVAEIDGKIIGHVLFSELKLSVDGRDVKALALAPIAVHADHQKAGVAAALIGAGHDLARTKGWQASIVLGEPAYYGRFGYAASTAAHIDSPYAGEYLQGFELVDGALDGDSGTMTYAAPFGALG